MQPVVDIARLREHNNDNNLNQTLHRGRDGKARYAFYLLETSLVKSNLPTIDARTSKTANGCSRRNVAIGYGGGVPAGHKYMHPDI